MEPGYFITATLMLTILAAQPVVAADDLPDVILHHGKIVTVDPAFSLKQALAIRGGRIVAVGADEDVLKLNGPATRVIDLDGRTVLPGLMDSHMHPAAASMIEFDHTIPTMETIADVLAYFRARAKVVPEGEWIVLQQVFITRLREQRWPTRAELDAAAPRHAVVFRTGPDASLNTLAMKLAGIDRNFKIPEGVPGLIEKDAAGEPNGVLRSWTNYVEIPQSASAAKATNAQRLDRLEELLRDYRATGLTSIADRDCGPEDMAAYQGLQDAGRLPVRVSLSRHINYIQATDAVVADIRKVAAEPLFTRHDPWLRIIGTKVYLDGGMLTGSAYMLEPWGVSKIYAITDPAYRGTLFIPLDKLMPMIRAAVENHLQFTAHTVGDGAVRTLMDAYSTVNKDLPVAAARPCISHSNFMSELDVQRMHELGVAIDVQPAWLYLDTRTLMQHFGAERLRWFQPLASIFKTGGIAGGGSDHMQKLGRDRSNNPYNPFLGIATAVTRRAKWFDGQLNPAECLTRQQALRLYTNNNAYILFCDKDLGSLEPGKLADLIVIDRDILQCPEDQIAGTKVLETWMDGKQVYKQ
jgi:hypothetical protein